MFCIRIRYHEPFIGQGSMRRLCGLKSLDYDSASNVASRERGGVGMLVVTRKKDEKLIIGNEIEIQVLRIGRDNVRLGIKAPSHISIYRYEIYEAIKKENVTATQSQIPDKDTMDALTRALNPETTKTATESE
jgi:carbon storage regulator